MKKIIALSTASALLAGLALTTSADENDERYIQKPVTPYYYMKAVDSDEYEALRDGALYIDRSELSEPKTYTIDMEAFLKDENLLVQVFFLKLIGRNDELRIVDAQLTETKYGVAPYSSKKGSPQPGSLWCRPEENRLGFGFSTTKYDPDPWVPAGEKSDDYPVGLFTLELSKDAEPGCYVIDYPNMKDGNNYVDINLLGPFAKSYSAADYSPKYYVHVSDKKLGDINDDGKITEEDAEYILNRVGRDNNKMKLFGSDRMACDVNGDEVIDDEDAELVMDYCLEYKGREPDMSLNEFIKSR